MNVTEKQFAQFVTLFERQAEIVLRLAAQVRTLENDLIRVRQRVAELEAATSPHADYH